MCLTKWGMDNIEILGYKIPMKLSYTFLIGFLLIGCGPSSGQLTATAVMAKTQTHQAAPTPTRTDTPTATPTFTPTVTITPSGTPTLSLEESPVLVGAGDIANCSSNGDEATASLLDDIPGTVFTTGDNVYPDGTAAEFANCYDPSWGRHKARTYPSVGNHDYHTSDATGYFDYFGAAAGEPGKGYYSYDLGAWHIIVLNSNLEVGAGSPQEQWLRTDLAAHPTTCTLAYWHHPLFSSGIRHGSDSSMRPLWQALYDFGADVVLNGHEHNYERFAPQNPEGASDPARGIREFVIGSGGRSHYPIVVPIANSEVQNANTYGVLKLTLHPDSYDWEFIPEAGKTFTDSGSGTCVKIETPTAVPTIGSSQVLAFTPVDDATVKANFPDDNYGSTKTINTDNSSAENFLLKFVVSGIDKRPVVSAVLRLYNVNPSDHGGVFRQVVDNSWSEKSMTWNTAPAAEPSILASLGPVSTNTWYEVDLTSLIMGDGTFSIRVSSISGDGADYATKEDNAEFSPSLIITIQ